MWNVWSWFWLVHRCCTSWRSPGRSHRKYWHDVDLVWFRDVFCFQNSKNKSKGPGQ